jgi:hypothetical protein
VGNDRSSPLVCRQAIVWIDDLYASILSMEAELEPVSTIRADRVDGQAKEPGSIESAVNAPNGYFDRVARAIDVADEILIVGPSATKLEFVKYMHKNDHSIDPRILGVETIAHPTDAQLAAFAKLYFTVGGPRRAGNGARHR